MGRPSYPCGANGRASKVPREAWAVAGSTRRLFHVELSDAVLKLAFPNLKVYVESQPA
jgi:hypothetical protein